MLNPLKTHEKRTRKFPRAFFRAYFVCSHIALNINRMRIITQKCAMFRLLKCDISNTKSELSTSPK